MSDDLEVGRRLREWRESLSVSSREAFAARLDVPEGVYPAGTYRNHETGKSLPNAAHFKRLAELGADVEWLITGRSTSRESAVPSELARSSKNVLAGNVEAEAAARDLVEIPHFLSRFSAGSGLPRLDDVQSSVFLPAAFVRRVIGRRPEVLVFANASGRSMAPTIEDGEFLAIDLSDKHLTNERIYAISIDGDLFVKRVRRLMFGGVEFSSDNAEFPDIERVDNISNVEAYVVGQVVWHGGAPL